MVVCVCVSVCVCMLSIAKYISPKDATSKLNFKNSHFKGKPTQSILPSKYENWLFFCCVTVAVARTFICISLYR